jgi:hypothetical protein
MTKRTAPYAQQIVITHQTQDSFVIDYEVTPLQLSSDPAIAVARRFQRDLL